MQLETDSDGSGYCKGKPVPADLGVRCVRTSIYFVLVLVYLERLSRAKSKIEKVYISSSQDEGCKQIVTK